MDNQNKKKIMKKNVKQLILLCLPVLLILAAYIVFVHTLDIEEKLTDTEKEIYSDIYITGDKF